MKNKDTEKLFRLAYYDTMTGVFNRNAYEEQLERLRKQHICLDNITVMIADLNDLKAINDTFGHHTGDEAIKAAASCILRTAGTKADVYRIGGDEFVCIAERDILSHIAELKDLIGFEAAEKIYPFSMSIGYERYDGKKHKSIDDIIKCADRRLYDSKKKGRKMR